MSYIYYPILGDEVSGELFVGLDVGSRKEGTALDTHRFFNS